MTIGKKFILRSTQPSQEDGSVLCLFSKSTFVDGVEQKGAEGHILVIPRYVGANADIPSDLPYLRRQLDLSADDLGFEHCSDDDWQTIFAVCQLAWKPPPAD